VARTLVQLTPHDSEELILSVRDNSDTLVKGAAVARVNARELFPGPTEVAVPPRLRYYSASKEEPWSGQQFRCNCSGQSVIATANIANCCETV
jgi:hypothetical protein